MPLLRSQLALTIEGEDTGISEIDDADDGDFARRCSNSKAQMANLDRLIASKPMFPRSDSRLFQNINFARKEFCLEELDTQILFLLLFYQMNPEFEFLADELSRKLRDATHTIAALTASKPEVIFERTRVGSRLVECGLFSRSVGTGNLISDTFELPRVITKKMSLPFKSHEEWRVAMLGAPLISKLDWEDFEHIGPARLFASNVLGAAAKSKSDGVSVMLHGPVGTGKTELAKVLAKHAGLSIWSVGETDDDGDEPTRGERLASLRFMQKLLANRRDAVLLFDECNDVLADSEWNFSGRGRRNGPGSKVFLNRSVEQNPVPIIWACNDPDLIDASILRRMSLAINVKVPNQVVRKRIWDRVLTNTDLALDNASIQVLAVRYAAPAGVVRNAARAASLVGGGINEIEAAMGGVLQLLKIGPSLVDCSAAAYDPALTNCGHDLAALTHRLSKPGASTAWSLCLYGAAGTGKSGFARYLAERLGLEVTQKRASDLMSKWVGETEKSIASAFEEARDHKSLLIFDEADSFLTDRRDAMRSWEVSQVNEMLTWMESHPYPFVCTTNLMEKLDPASLRRFTFKLKFELLLPNQAQLAFERFFGMPPPRPLPPNLSPGDFATVARRRTFFDGASADELADWLDEEVAAKERPSRPIGFTCSL